MHVGDIDKTHRFAYWNVIKYKPLWNKTTDRYKRFVLLEYLKLLKSEKLNGFISKLFINELIKTLE